MQCETCNNLILTPRSKRSQSGYYFCSTSCAAKYNNQYRIRNTAINMVQCKGCDKMIHPTKTYCSSMCYREDRKRKSHGRDKQKQKKNVLSFMKRSKLKAIQYLGGCCTLCGYNRCPTALQFHHRNPETKKFQISGKSYSWEKLKEELDKCNLLCANCHAEVESGWRELNPQLFA